MTKRTRQRGIIVAWADSVDIVFTPPANVSIAYRDAANHYAGRTYSSVPVESVITYLRHECTNYDALLKMITGATGQRDAYEIIRQRVDDVITRWMNEK